MRVCFLKVIQLFSRLVDTQNSKFLSKTQKTQKKLGILL